MYRIEVKEWELKSSDGKISKGSLLSVIGSLVSNKKPDELPKGFVQFQLFNKLVKSFEKAEESKVLELEESVYKFLKNIVEKDIPANWAADKNIVEVIQTFMNARDD